MRALDKSKGIFMDLICWRRGWREKGGVIPKDAHLTWKLSDDVVIVLRFDCHGRALSEMLLAFSVFLFV